MKKISDVLKQARVDKNIPVDRLEDITKIRLSFIRAIENGDWDNL